MDIGLGKKIIEDMVLVEFVIIIVLVIATYLLKFNSYFLEKRRMKLIKDIQQYVANLVKLNKTINADTFKRKWKKVEILFPIMTDFDKQYEKNVSWVRVKSDLLSVILLPLARKNAHSRRWIARFFASEIFGLVAEPQDEPLIIKLVNDTVPLVYLHAISAAIRCHSQMAINLVMKRIADVSWLTQLIYLDQFEHIPSEIFTFVENSLQSSSEPLVRAACYKVLRKYSAAKIKWDTMADLNSENFELRLAAMKLITHVEKEAAVPMLISKLKDDHWEIRLVALHRLGTLKAAQSCLAIASCLHDKEWSVKISAAEALKSFGSEGEKLLKLNAPELELVPFDATKHISHSLW